MQLVSDEVHQVYYLLLQHMKLKSKRFMTFYWQFAHVTYFISNNVTDFLICLNFY